MSVWSAEDEPQNRQPQDREDVVLSPGARVIYLDFLLSSAILALAGWTGASVCRPGGPGKLPDPGGLLGALMWRGAMWSQVRVFGRNVQAPARSWWGRVGWGCPRQRAAQGWHLCEATCAPKCARGKRGLRGCGAPGGVGPGGLLWRAGLVSVGVRRGRRWARRSRIEQWERRAIPRLPCDSYKRGLFPPCPQKEARLAARLSHAYTCACPARLLMPP